MLDLRGRAMPHDQAAEQAPSAVPWRFRGAVMVPWRGNHAGATRSHRHDSAATSRAASPRGAGEGHGKARHNHGTHGSRFSGRFPMDAFRQTPRPGRRNGPTTHEALRAIRVFFTLMFVLCCAMVAPAPAQDSGAAGPGTAAPRSEASPAEAINGSAETPDSASGSRRLREGMEVVDCRGQFRRVGDRLAFFSDDGSVKLVCLENLMLDRIALSMAENPEALTWTITGTVTEYRGSNYLLIRRAVLVHHPVAAP